MPWHLRTVDAFGLMSLLVQREGRVVLVYEETVGMKWPDQGVFVRIDIGLWWCQPAPMRSHHLSPQIDARVGSFSPSRAFRG